MLGKLRQITTLSSYNFKELPLDCFLSWPHPLHRFVREMEKEDCVLDVGCGDGNLVKAVNHYKGCKCTGIDIVKIENTEKVSFFQADITRDKFPFPDNIFDYIVMNHVLEHLLFIDHTLAEIKRVLKPGGKLYIETPNTRTILLPSLNYKVEQGMPVNFYDDPSHIRPFSELALWHTLKHKFKPVKTGKSRNWFSVVKAPIMIVKGFLAGNRSDIFYYTWQLIGGASYIVCSKES